MAQIAMKSSASDRFQTIDDFRAYPITSQFFINLQVSEPFRSLEASKKNLIQIIWEKEQKRREGKLHEGTILSALGHDNKSLQGQFVPYKYFLAQLCDPSLKADLKIVPVSISGLTTNGKEIIIAKRASWVSQYPNCYELAPSGGVRLPNGELNVIDLKIQLLEELEEEIGIQSALVKSIKFFSLLHDLKEDSIEICGEIRLKTSQLVLSSTDEYSQVIALSLAELKSFVNENEANFVPLSLMILKLKSLI